MQPSGMPTGGLARVPRDHIAPPQKHIYTNYSVVLSGVKAGFGDLMSWWGQNEDNRRAPNPNRRTQSPCFRLYALVEAANCRFDTLAEARIAGLAH